VGNAQRAFALGGDGLLIDKLGRAMNNTEFSFNVSATVRVVSLDLG
jgi:hypothetical protein